MLVHFPLVLWLAVPVFDILALSSSAQPWWGVALVMTAAGVAIGAIAVLTGLLDYIHLSDTGSNDVRLAARHGVRTGMVWAVMSVKLIVAMLNPVSQGLLVGCLVVDVLACGLLVQGSFFGTKITYGRYGS